MNMTAKIEDTNELDKINQLLESIGSTAKIIVKSNDDHDIEDDILGCPIIMEKIKNSEEYSKKLYAAFCNQSWKHPSCEYPYGMTWRSAGGLIANFRNKIRGKEEGSEDILVRYSQGEERTGDFERYTDFYCSGNEGHVDPEIEEDLGKLGWFPVEDKE